MKTVGLSISLLALLVWGCSSDNRNDSEALPEADLSTTSLSAQSLALQDRNWLLLAYGLSDEDKVELIDNTAYTLEFSDSQVIGTLDCNQFSTGYSSSLHQLSFNSIAATEIACQSNTVTGYWAQESFITNALASAVSYEITDNTLTITASDSSQLIYQQVDVPSTLPDSDGLALQGNEWLLTAYGYSGDSANNTVLIEQNGTPSTYYSLIFDASGKVEGALDCNTLFATYTTENEQLAISAIASTDMACAGMGEASYMAREEFILNALSSAVSYNISGAKLVITTSDSSQLTYRPVEKLALIL